MGLQVGALIQQRLPLLGRVLIHLAPLAAVRDSIWSARREAARIRKFVQSGGKQFRILYSEKSSFPGLGDYLVTVALANFLEQLGLACDFQLKDFEGDAIDRHAERIQLLRNFGPKGTIDPRKPTLEVFDARVSKGEDISAPTLSLISFLQQDARINPLGLAPALGHHPSPNGINQRSLNFFIAIHVRASGHAPDRNPQDDLVIKDLLEISRVFPNIEIRWFGERAKFDSIRQLLPTSLAEVLAFQTSTTFSEAGEELEGCLFWFQRSGGGIGVYALFSRFPYLILSTDVAATRLYRRKGLSLVPWARRWQQYHIQVFTEQKSLASAFRYGRWKKKIEQINFARNFDQTKRLGSEDS